MSNGVAVGQEHNNVQQNGYGSGQVLGLDVQFSKMLGDVVVENYLNQLSEDDMKLINDYITRDLFDYQTIHEYGKEDRIEKIVKEDWTTSEGSSWSRVTHKSVGSQIKDMFNARFKEEMQKKVEEIIASDEYVERIDKIAHEVIDYCVEGYKEDLMNSIREKLIGNLMHNEQYYGGISISEAIQNTMQSYVHI